MKVSELTGAMLDYWVAKADGVPNDAISWAGGSGRDGVIWERVCVHNYGFNPSRSWEKGGPIIERENISISGPAFAEHKGTWHATSAVRPVTADVRCPCYGFTAETPLIAAMRAFVASKFGETVPDEVTA